MKAEKEKKMRIKEDIKLNFDDVLMEPKRSTLSSRRDVDMTRKFTFRNSNKVMNFTPIFASNMDGVGTFSMAKILQEYQMMTVITKTTPIEAWRKAVGSGLRLQSVSVCTGTNKIFDPEAITATYSFLFKENIKGGAVPA